MHTMKHLAIVSGDKDSSLRRYKETSPDNLYLLIKNFILNLNQL